MSPMQCLKKIRTTSVGPASELQDSIVWAPAVIKLIKKTREAGVPKPSNRFICGLRPINSTGRENQAFITLYVCHMIPMRQSPPAPNQAVRPVWNKTISKAS